MGNVEISRSTYTNSSHNAQGAKNIPAHYTLPSGDIDIPFPEEGLPQSVYMINQLLRKKEE